MAHSDSSSVIIEPAAPARAAVIWMHGLGADAHDFEPIVPELRLPDELAIRFIFPNATPRPISLNGGMAMRGWFDLSSLDITGGEDATGIRDSQQVIEGLVEAQIGQGVPAERIVLAGFSQGAAMALQTGLRYPDRLAGIMALSGWLPLAGTLADQRSDANREVPILMAHGSYDNVVAPRYADASREALTALGYPVEWHSYPMAHQVCLEQIQDISRWLRDRLG